MSDGIPVGLLDPVLWRKSRWTMARAVMKNGRMKWKAKNRVRVAFSTLLADALPSEPPGKPERS